MKIQVFYRQVYGTQLCYPADELARKFASLAGCATFTRPAIKTIQEIGIALETVADPKAPKGWGLAETGVGYDDAMSKALWDRPDKGLIP